MCAQARYAALQRLAHLGQQIESRRRPDPYPRPTGPPPSLEELRRRRDEVTRISAPRGGLTVRVFGSVARGDSDPSSDLDLLVEMRNGTTLFEQAALQGDLEDLLGCRVHVLTTSGLRHASEGTREQIEREAVLL